MLADLFQHVVEESQARRNVAFTRTIKVYAHVDVCFFRGSSYFCHSLSSKENLGNLIPRHSVVAQYQRLAT